MTDLEIRKKALELAVQAYCADVIYETTSIVHKQPGKIGIGDYDAITKKAEVFEDYIRGKANSGGVSHPLTN